jgi:hypothetical protein
VGMGLLTLCDVSDILGGPFQIKEVGGVCEGVKKRVARISIRVAEVDRTR